jgi:hypothetical protein
MEGVIGHMIAIEVEEAAEEVVVEVRGIIGVA